MAFLTSLRDSLLFGFILIFGHAILGVIAHEFGHLVFGKLTGYRFSSFRVGPLVLFRENDRITFKFSRSIIAGQCLMAPPENFDDFKFVLYNLGGVIFNFLLFGVFLYLGVRDGITFNLVLAISNLVPVKAWTNDGFNLCEALKSKDAAYGFYMMMYVNHKLVEGERYRDFDEELFKIDDEADFGNTFVAYMVMLRASRFEDLGQYDAAQETLSRLDLTKLPPIYRAMTNAVLLYCCLIYNPDFDRAREIYKDKKLRKILKSGLPSFMRIAIAYEFFVLNDKKISERSDYLLKKAKKAANNLPNVGQREMELEYIQKLEEQICRALTAS